MRIYDDRYPYKLDPKHRVSVPVAFRPEEDGASIRLQLSTEHGKEKVIKVFTNESFQDKFRQIEEANIPQANKLALAGALRMNSREATISTQGKLTVPKEWAEKIGLRAEGGVLLAGRNSYYIICSEDTFTRIEEADFLMDDGGLGVL